MIINNIEDQLARDEGSRLDVYADQYGWLTTGIGHCFHVKTLDEVPPQFRNGITIMQRNQLFSADLHHVYDLMDVYLPWWASLDKAYGPRSGVLLNMAFNMGVVGLSKFTTFLDYMKNLEWEKAASDLESTAVYKQLPERYGRLARQIRTGVWQ